ncbi:MAG: hypothetical protein P4N24_06355 [Acidobacteriota bacterium]|nr:hypothetical protein [Acidobacteriota bacterium]
MHTRHLKQFISLLMPRSLHLLAAATALLLILVPLARAQSVDFDPAALSKQRSAILLKATHTPITDLEGDVNHLAVLSETCRVESGAKACGLSDKPLESTNLEDRYAYYVRRPVELHASGRQVKINRHNWEAPASASR